jgi:hypothetical protein
VSGEMSDPDQIAIVVIAPNQFAVTVGVPGPSGPAAVNYIPVRTAVHTIAASDLIVGINIVGVNFAGPVTVYIPQNIQPNRLLTVKDESGAAGTNPITLVAI